MPPERVLDLLRRRPAVPAVEPRGFLGDALDLADAGWGVVFPPGGGDPRVREALAPLLDLRRRQAGARDPRRYREIELAPGETAGDLLRRLGVGPGPAVPRKLPYYLLLAGSPEQIPYELQYRLDVQYAAGRLWFDEVEAFASYARTVVGAERGELRRPRRACLFGVRNPGDRATELSCDGLVAPLAERLAGEHPRWAVDAVLAGDATRARLAALAGGEDPAALVFTASHGVGYASGDHRQLSRQGALVCQDWPGPGGGGLRPEHSLAGDDVAAGPPPAGLVTFHFACYGAGTPEHDDFAHKSHVGDGPWTPGRVAPRPFVARLPQRLLGHPGGGALAAIGHVERAWSTSVLWGEEAQTEVFAAALEQLLDGYPVGAAMEFFGQRYAELATDLGAAFWRERCGLDTLGDELARLWTAHHDARNYVLLGDPAVRLAVDGG